MADLASWPVGTYFVSGKTKCPVRCEFSACPDSPTTRLTWYSDDGSSVLAGFFCDRHANARIVLGLDGEMNAVRSRRPAQAKS